MDLCSQSILGHATITIICLKAGIWPNPSSPFYYLSSLCMPAVNSAAVTGHSCKSRTTKDVWQKHPYRMKQSCPVVEVTGLSCASGQVEGCFSPSLVRILAGANPTSLFLGVCWFLAKKMQAPTCGTTWSWRARSKSSRQSFPMRMPVLHSPVWRVGILLPAPTRHLKSKVQERKGHLMNAFM